MTNQVYPAASDAPYARLCTPEIVLQYEKIKVKGDWTLLGKMTVTNCRNHRTSEAVYINFKVFKKSWVQNPD